MTPPFLSTCNPSAYWLYGARHRRARVRHTVLCETHTTHPRVEVWERKEESGGSHSLTNSFAQDSEPWNPDRNGAMYPRAGTDTVRDTQENHSCAVLSGTSTFSRSRAV
jgi:hypothetical protein